ncbi:3-dehydroquinate synthase family protein [Nonomuraea turkmeniaca]|uniref:3-dehydroquinate synthase family protein n=1 Tax=Nonomuraea turkmeniaca TaxID=103838 RepID=UPI001476D7FF|nr:3-dehydroquinate synthase family protein [Nonomuraea turkmeniaca]
MTAAGTKTGTGIVTAAGARAVEGRLDVADTGTGFTVSVRSTDAYPIHLGHGIADDLASRLAPLVARLGSPSVVIAADTGVTHLLPRLLQQIRAIDVPVTVTPIPAGETSKSLPGLQILWQSLVEAGASRRTLLLGLGGGMVCDLIAVAAATYMRGLPYALIPTTVLAQVDAAVGGKGGIDYAGAKNLLGAFHHPAMVIIDPELTRTLPARQVRNGLAEVIKVALIADPALFADLERHSGQAPHGPALTPIVRAAVAAKLALLADDPFERGDLRRLLNLGHCIGHPLEAATGYRMLHGEAVAAGIATAVAVAHARGLATSADRARILNLLAAYQLPISITPALRGRIWQRVEIIRRIRNGPLYLVVPYRPGECGVLDDICHAEFESALNDLAHPTRARP